MENLRQSGARPTIGVKDEEPPIFLKPSQEIWSRCNEYARKHDLTTLQAFEELIRAGEEEAKYIEEGGIIFGKKGETYRKFIVFGKNGKASQNG
jgi:hypothetical protein